jgi:hypothetical protein
MPAVIRRRGSDDSLEEERMKRRKVSFHPGPGPMGTQGGGLPRPSQHEVFSNAIEDHCKQATVGRDPIIRLFSPEKGKRTGKMRKYFLRMRNEVSGVLD